MSFIDFITGKNHKEVAVAIRDNNLQLAELTKALNDRESPERIRQAIQAGLQAGNLEQCLTTTAEHLNSLNSTIKSTSTTPMPVQTFPLVDNFQYEDEKKKLAAYSSALIQIVSEEFITKLKNAHQPVDKSMMAFFSQVDEHTKNPESNNYHLNQAMGELLLCSPKRVVAAFQKNALEAGWLIVSKFNCLIDLLAKEYPRCRAGIYGSRLNYSDVIQISDEILATLKATSTVLDDVQRRHDLLDALKAEVWNDLHNSEIQKIWDAIGASFADSLKLTNKDMPWYQKMWKGPVSVAFGELAWATAVVSAPSAQFQGQLARAQRVRVFVATAILLRANWTEWSKMNQNIVVPNLVIMFTLKGDFARNRIISIADLITVNGHSLEGVTDRISSAINKQIK